CRSRVRPRLRSQRLAAGERGSGSVEFVRVRRHQRKRRRGTGPSRVMRRVAVTGIGLVSAFGCDAETVWRALCAGESATRALDYIVGNRVGVIGAPVCGFSAREYI